MVDKNDKQVVPLLPFFGLSGYFAFGVRFNKFIGTYLCGLSTLVLQVQHCYLIFDILSPFLDLSVLLFRPFGAIPGVGFRWENIFGT